MNKDKRFCLII